MQEESGKSLHGRKENFVTNLQKVLTSHFGNLSIDVVRTSDSPEPGVTREQLGQMLGYENPAIAIGKIHDRYRSRIDNFATLSKTVNAAGMSIYDRNGKMGIRDSQNPVQA